MNFFLQIDIIIALIIIIYPDFFLSLLFTNGWAFTSQNYDMFPGFILSTVAIFSFCHGIKKRIIYEFFISQFWLFSSQICLYLTNQTSQNCGFISCNSGFYEFILRIMIKKARIVRYKLWIVRKSLNYQLYFIILLFNSRNKLPKEGDSADSY